MSQGRNALGWGRLALGPAPPLYCQKLHCISDLESSRESRWQRIRRARPQLAISHLADAISALTPTPSVLPGAPRPIKWATVLHQGAWAKVDAIVRENASSLFQRRRRSRLHLIFCKAHGNWLCHCVVDGNGIAAIALRPRKSACRLLDD